MNDRQTQEDRYWSALAFLVLLVYVAAIFLIFYRFPWQYGRLIREDDFGESITFAAFLLAVAGFAWLTMLSGTARSRYWYLLLAIGCAVAAMEEVSWGQRFVGVPAPDFVRQHNIQGELNFHNLTEGSLHSAYTFGTLALFAFGVLLPLLERLVPAVRSLADRIGLPAPPLRLAPLFAAPLSIWVFTGFAERDEIVELLTSLAFSTFAVDRLWIKKSRNRPDRPAHRAVVTISVVVVCISVSPLLMRISAPIRSLESLLLTHASESLPDNGYLRQADLLFEQLEARADDDSRTAVKHARAAFLSRYGDADEARRLYNTVIANDLWRLRRDDDDLSTLIRLLEAHARSGNRSEAEGFLAQLERAIRLELHEIRSRPPTDPDRPGWTQDLWDEEARSFDRAARLLIHLGDAYSEVGKHARALDEYLAAAQFATWGNTKRFLRTRYMAVALKCLSDGSTVDLDPDKIEETILRRTNFCRRGSG